MPEFYMVGNTHFDPVWEWTWDEAMASIRATFRSALDRMEEYPDFCYSFSSPLVFEWIKRTQPEMFEEIKKRVDEGRWDLAEGWWDQPDCFSASGESYVRQGLYGQRWLMRNFGRYSECAFNTDSFGHPDMLPQILSKSGIKYYCLCRPEEYHCPLKAPLFRWKSRDGSAILSFRIGGNAGDGWTKDPDATIERVKASGEELLIVYGVTDHGGAPTKEAIEKILRRADAHFSTVGGYFERQKDVGYELTDEFISGDFGVYSNNAAVKQLNRAAEYALLNAESSCVIAGESYTEQLCGCWQDVLFNQFHDILGGACVKAAYSDARNLHGRALQTANEILHFNLQRVTAQIQMPGKNPDNAWNLVLWNLNCCEYDGYVEAEVQWAHEFEWYDGGITLEDEAGNRVQTQIIAERSAIPGFRSRFIFKAAVPSMGYKCFKVIRDGSAFERKTQEFPLKLETARYEFVFSGENGCIESVYDKKSGRKAAGRLFVPACYSDEGDTWCFNVDSYGEKLGEFSLVSAETVESGELSERVKLTLRYGSSVLCMHYTFYHGEDYFDVDYRVGWNEAHTVFKLDCESGGDSVTVSTPYSHMRRGRAKADRPMGEWLRADGLLFLTGSNFAYNFYDDTLGITVLRSPVYGDLRLGALRDRDHDVMEQGETSGRIRVMLGEKERLPCNEAMRMNNRPIVICESNHDGKLPQTNSFASLKAEGAVLSVVKYAEDGDGIILRIVDHSGKQQDAVLSLLGKEHAVHLGAYEIKTLKTDGRTVWETDLLERAAGERQDFPHLSEMLCTDTEQDGPGLERGDMYQA